MPSGPDSSTIPSGGGPLVYVDDLEHPVLMAEDHHHLARVRRVRDGDALVLGDGSGAWRLARMAGSSPEPVDVVRTVPAPVPQIGVAFALVKGSKPELVVQKLTELGVDRICPFVAARSVVRWDPAKAEAAHQRLQKVSREAAMQSRQAHLAEVGPVVEFATVAATRGAALAERGGEAPSLDHRFVLVGPEGGWDASELAAGLPRVGLATGVLRAETGAIVAGALLVALRAGLVAPGA